MEWRLAVTTFPSSCRNVEHPFLVGISGQVAQPYGHASYPVPCDAPYLGEVGGAEVVGAAVEVDAGAVAARLPEASAMAAVVAPRQQVLVQPDVAETKLSVYRDDEFLHGPVVSF